MATADYIDGRIKYRRPQAILFSNNPGTLVSNYSATGKVATLASGAYTIFVQNGVSGIYVGQTVEKTSGTGAVAVGATVVSIDEATSVITLSAAHTTAGAMVFKTGSTSFVPQGVEFEDFIFVSDHNRSALKFAPERIEKRERMVNGRMRSYHVADKMKLSTSWDNLPSRAYPLADLINTTTGKSTVEPYTVDGGAGGNDLLKWYEDHVGSFYVYLAYDKYTAFGNDDAAYGHMHQYNQVIEMYVADFSHEVSKRGSLFDFWNVSISLEEA